MKKEDMDKKIEINSLNNLQAKVGRYLNNTRPCLLGVFNTTTAPLQRGTTHTMSVLDMTLNHLIVRLQSWSKSGQELKQRIALYLWLNRTKLHTYANLNWLK